jgi:hypothetical protein
MVFGKEDGDKYNFWIKYRRLGKRIKITDKRLAD